jgi:hypothetical protein
MQQPIFVLVPIETFATVNDGGGAVLTSGVLRLRRSQGALNTRSPILGSQCLQGAFRPLTSDSSGIQALWSSLPERVVPRTNWNPPS